MSTAGLIGRGKAAPRRARCCTHGRCPATPNVEPVCVPRTRPGRRKSRGQIEATTKVATLSCSPREGADSYLSTRLTDQGRADAWSRHTCHADAMVTSDRCMPPMVRTVSCSRCVHTSTHALPVLVFQFGACYREMGHDIIRYMHMGVRETCSRAASRSSSPTACTTRRWV